MVGRSLAIALGDREDAEIEYSQFPPWPPCHCGEQRTATRVDYPRDTQICVHPRKSAASLAPPSLRKTAPPPAVSLLLILEPARKPHKERPKMTLPVENPHKIRRKCFARARCWCNIASNGRKHCSNFKEVVTDGNRHDENSARPAHGRAS